MHSGRTTGELPARADGRAAVVKANAYGLGAVRVVEALRREGCRDFFVATLSEGIELRGANPDASIFVLSGPLDDRSALAMVRHALTPVLNDANQLERWREHRETPAGVCTSTRGCIGLASTTGRSRRRYSRGSTLALYSPIWRAPTSPAIPMNQRQVVRFESIRSRFPDAVASLANSAGALSGIGTGMTRAGIALYGGNPFATQPNPMAAVGTLEARVIALRTVAAGRNRSATERHVYDCAGNAYRCAGRRLCGRYSAQFVTGRPCRLPGQQATRCRPGFDGSAPCRCFDRRD